MKVGRPPSYRSNKELAAKVEEYFINCPDKRIIHFKDNEIEVPHPTISGLAYHLGFESRQSVYEYELKDEFTYTIKRARLFIEKIYETLLMDNPTGAIFALKNLGWVDVLTNKNVNVNSEEIPKEDIEKIVKELKNEYL